MLILLRHGRTSANAEGRLQGRVDNELDEVGERQATAAAEQLSAQHAIGRIVSSPLRRARQTADAFGRPYDIDERWIELSYGIYEGVPHRDVPSEVWNLWRDDPDFVPEGGESLAALDARVRVACDDLLAEAAEHDVLVVSHVSPMKSAVAWSLGVGIEISWRSHLSHAAICRIDVRLGRPCLLTFNETVDVD